jgi:hypothetical protein
VGWLKRLLGTSDETTSSTARSESGYGEAWILDESSDWLDIKGEGSYQANIERAAGGRTPDGPAKREQVALLVPEPTNRYDANAIQIRIAGRIVGYLAKESRSGASRHVDTPAITPAGASPVTSSRASSTGCRTGEADRRRTRPPPSPAEVGAEQGAGGPIGEEDPAGLSNWAI